MEKITYFAAMEGISLEHMVRYGKFDMRVKHFHNEYEIFYILDGVRNFFFNNRSFVATKGDLILVDANLIHMTKSVSDDDHGHNRIILYVAKDKMEELEKKHVPLPLVRFFYEHHGVYHLDETQRERFMGLYYRLKQEFNHKQPHYKQMIELEVVSYFIDLIRELSKKEQELPACANENKYRTAYAIADYLSEHCEENISLEELAGRFFLSKYYLCRLFKEVTGYTTSEYVNIHRIKKAKRYLEETDYSIAHIAQLLGFESLTYFEKLFKIYMTISPLKYRKTLNIVTYTNQPSNP